MSGSHISNSTEEVGEVAMTPLTRHMSAEFGWNGVKQVGSAPVVIPDPAVQRTALVIVVLGMDVTKGRDVQWSCAAREMGNRRADKIVRDRSIVTGMGCHRRCEPPLGFYGPYENLYETRASQHGS